MFKFKYPTSLPKYSATYNSGIRCFSSSSLLSSRPILAKLLPGKKTMNRLLFDNDSRLAYKKIVSILDSVYNKLDTPDEIRLPSYTKSGDLMLCKTILTTIRQTTNSINKHLVSLENELVEQAAELGDNDAIAILAFETIQDPNSSKQDYDYANTLIKGLTNIKHPLVFKLAGDLAFTKGYYNQAVDYWKDFLQLEPDTILASQVYANLGLYYLQYLKPKPDLCQAKLHFEKSIKFGELDKFTIQSHYYLGQLYSITDPQLSKYHLEISASKGLKESFPSLGFLEMNVFNNYSKSIEWFKLGVESNNDLTCLIGQFDCYVTLKNSKKAFDILAELKSIQNKLQEVVSSKRQVPQEFADTFNTNQSLLQIFFDTRKSAISHISQNFV